MKSIKKLPDAEFEIMKVVWQNEPPMSTNQIISGLGSGNSWKPQTVLTLLIRLIEKGFLSSVKVGKERTYSPPIKKGEYVRSETGSFFDKLHSGSIYSFVNRPVRRRETVGQRNRQFEKLA